MSSAIYLSSVNKIEEGAIDRISKNQIANQEQSRFLAVVVHVALILLTLLGLTVYIASASAISCRIMDKMIKAQSCHVTVRPFSNLWQAPVYFMLALNVAAAALFLQGLMLGFKIGHGDSFRRSPCVVPVSLRKSCVSESALDGSVLRLVYTTRCSDDVVIRAQLPSSNSGSKKSRWNGQGSLSYGQVSDQKQQQQQLLRRQQFSMW